MTKRIVRICQLVGLVIGVSVISYAFSDTQTSSVTSNSEPEQVVTESAVTPTVSADGSEVMATAQSAENVENVENAKSAKSK